MIVTSKPSLKELNKVFAEYKIIQLLSQLILIRGINYLINVFAMDFGTPCVPPRKRLNTSSGAAEKPQSPIEF